MPASVKGTQAGMAVSLRGAGDYVSAPTEGESQVAEIQRSRLLAAAIRTVDELGYTGVTVAQITARARVSRRTFYELFPNRERCLSAVFEEVVGLIEAELAELDLARLGWPERVRAGLWAMLCFFDREPVLARFCVVQALRGGPELMELRERTLERLSGAVDEGRCGQRAGRRSALAAEGVVGGCFAIVHARLLRGEYEPLAPLLGELMGILVLPYLGPAAARREQERPTTVALKREREGDGAVTAGPADDPLDGLRMRVTYRTARVLESIAERPGASNRAISSRAGIGDQGQISKLLARLERLGLLENEVSDHVKGEPNAWRLTARGELVCRSIRVHLEHRAEVAA